MIHSLSCNTRDCPWYRRGSKCRHPLAVSVKVAEKMEHNVPLLCPVRIDPQVLVVTTPKPKELVLKSIDAVCTEMNDWKRLVEVTNP